ncbi:MAG: formyltransferase family protein [Thermoleophilia bacterium]
MKFGFVTCVQLGLSCMEAIYEAGGKLNLVITLNDDQAKEKSGRVYLDEFCRNRSITLLKTPHVNDKSVVSAIERHNLDWLFIIGWSQIAGKATLAAPKRGVLGIHPTLLPQGRGRAPIPWAILKGLDKTGVTLFKLDDGIDTGPIVDQLVIHLASDTTATELYQLVDKAHIDLIKQVIPKLLSNRLTPVDQDDTLATEWPARQPEDGEIDLDGSAEEAERLVRSVTHPYPGAFIETEYKRYIIWSARVVDSPSDGLYFRFGDTYLECVEWDEQPMNVK